MKDFKNLFNEMKTALGLMSQKMKFEEYTEDNLKVAAREVGAKVEIVKDDGTLETAPDGHYQLGDFGFDVKDGVIVSIDGEEKPAEGDTKEMADEEVTSEEKPSNDLSKDVDELKVVVAALTEKMNEVIASQNAVIDAQKAATDMKAQFEQMGKAFEVTNEAIKKFSGLPVTESKVTKSTVVEDSKQRAKNEMLNVFAKMNGK